MPHPKPQPRHGMAAVSRFFSSPVGGSLSLCVILALISTEVGLRAQTATLFPPETLVYRGAPETSESSSAYAESNFDDRRHSASDQHDERFLDRGDRSLPHPISHSHNLEWIEANRRNGSRTFNYYRQDGFVDPVPAYQVYSRQQHHGRSRGFENFVGLSSPAGFGHGGFQSQFSNSARGFDQTREPNFQVGPFSANFTGYTSTEWIDRLPTTVQAASGVESSDGLFILSGGIDTSAALQVSERGVIEVQIGAGFDYYPDGRPGNGGLEGDHLDFQVLPNTYASYSFGVGEVELSIYDRFALYRNRAYSYYSLDPLDYADYQENVIGATARLPINDRLSVDAGYEFGQLDSLGEGGELLDRDSQSVFGTIAYSPDQAWEIGVQASASSFDYAVYERPDGSSSTVGVFGNLPLSEYTRISASAGVHRFEFDEVEGFADSSSLENGYWNASLENDLNDRLTHSVSIGEGAAIGISSNYVQSSQLGYSLQFRVFDSTVVTGGVNFLRSTESDVIFGEEIESVYYHLGVRHQVTEHTSLGLSYSHSDNNSDLDDRDYDQQRLQAYCSIDLNESLELRASYQRWDVDSSNEVGGFGQNSATLGLTYKF